MWRGAARMAERFALTGVGPLAFNIAYPAYKMPDAQIDEVHAHDLPLNVLIENGVLGFAALIWMRRRGRQRPEKREEHHAPGPRTRSPFRSTDHGFHRIRGPEQRRFGDDVRFLDVVADDCDHARTRSRRNRRESQAAEIDSAAA